MPEQTTQSTGGDDRVDDMLEQTARSSETLEETTRAADQPTKEWSTREVECSRSTDEGVEHWSKRHRHAA